MDDVNIRAIAETIAFGMRGAGLRMSVSAATDFIERILRIELKRLQPENGSTSEAEYK